MNYYELRKIAARIVPRMTKLMIGKKKQDAVREKGRKKNYHQFSLKTDEWVKQERLLNTEEINSFLEISLRAPACPMPFNMDIWDGLICIAKGELITTKRGFVKVENIVEGDVVLSYNEQTSLIEWKPVLQVRTTRKIRMVEIETEKGILRVTADHRVYTQRGWIEAEFLLPIDIIYSYV